MSDIKDVHKGLRILFITSTVVMFMVLIMAIINISVFYPWKVHHNSRSTLEVYMSNNNYTVKELRQGTFNFVLVSEDCLRINSNLDLKITEIRYENALADEREIKKVYVNSRTNQNISYILRVKEIKKHIEYADSNLIDSKIIISTGLRIVDNPYRIFFLGMSIGLTIFWFISLTLTHKYVWSKHEYRYGF